MMRGNWALLIAALGGLLATISAAAGAHEARWQLIFWPALTVANSLLAYFYSRQVD